MQGAVWPAPWSQIVAGIAIGMGLPVPLPASPPMETGIFASDADGQFVFRIAQSGDLASGAAQRTFGDWYATALERHSP